MIDVRSSAGEVLQSRCHWDVGGWWGFNHVTLAGINEGAYLVFGLVCWPG